MDCHSILRTLTTKHDKNNLDEKLEIILCEVLSQLPIESKQSIEINCKADDNSVQRKYLQTILHVLSTLQTDVLSISETFMSVNEYRVVKLAIELVISIGIIPCLIPGIGAGLSRLNPNASQFSQELLTDLQKYDRLKTSIRILTDCYREISLRPAILTQLGPILGALIQLAHAPLIKPTDVNSYSSDFQMTDTLYNKLLNDQAEFKIILNNLIKNCQQSCIIKELMVLLGIEGVPNWLKRNTRDYLVNCIIEPNGVMSLISVTCNETLDTGKDWEKLDIISKLIVTPHLKDSEHYYNAVCKQLLCILYSKDIKHAVNIANSCITALYEVESNICIEKIFYSIAEPFRIKNSDCAGYPENSVIKSETEVSKSVDSLVKCFIPKDGKFKCLPHLLLNEIALPLFQLQRKIYNSASLIKFKVRELLIYLLTHEESCEELFSVFLDHELHTNYYGERLRFEFASEGGVEIQRNTQDNNFEKDWSEYGDTLFDLVKADENLSLKVINYLFKWLLISHENKLKLNKEESLERYNLLMKMMCQQMIAGKIISDLGSKSSIQKMLFKSPEPLLSFVTALYPNAIDTNVTFDADYEILYAGLMLVKVIVIEGGNLIDWTQFNNFSNVLNEKLKLKFPSSLLTLTREVIKIIKTRGMTPRFQDLSINNEKEENFEKALRDLADPLLPVRAHGLMTMTKLIESSDPIAIAKKDLVLCFFQENLKDDDSFVYLTAINGLCAMAISFPQQVIELLINEFINMPKRNQNDELTPENRVKLGEILVKTTRSLGDMASTYKSTLINGFLCGVRDSDSMVRASSLSCLGELCKVLGFHLGNTITEILYCIGCIIQTDKSYECRRAAVLVITLLIRGLGKNVLTHLASDLLPVYRGLKHLRDNDKDDVLRLHAQLALEEINDIVENILFEKPALEKNIFLIH